MDSAVSHPGSGRVGEAPGPGFVEGGEAAETGGLAAARTQWVVQSFGSSGNVAEVSGNPRTAR
jgi:hypothetical protein